MAKQLTLADICDSQPVPRGLNAAEVANGQAQRQSAEADDVLTVREVAALLKLSPRTVGEYGARGLLPSVKIGRHRRFSKRQLEGLIGSGLKNG
jgi:excisionase family DNA binding protein